MEKEYDDQYSCTINVEERGPQIVLKASEDKYFFAVLTALKKRETVVHEKAYFDLIEGY